MFLYFLKQKLPWQGVQAETKQEKMKKIYEIKKNIKLEKLCEKCPKEFLIYMRYCKKLRYSEKPDYFYLKQLFRNLFNRRKYKFDYNYDWNKIKV